MTRRFATLDVFTTRPRAGNPLAGWDRPKASDHCPLTIDLTIPKETA